MTGLYWVLLLIASVAIGFLFCMAAIMIVGFVVGIAISVIDCKEYVNHWKEGDKDA